MKLMCNAAMMQYCERCVHSRIATCNDGYIRRLRAWSLTGPTSILKREKTSTLCSFDPTAQQGQPLCVWSDDQSLWIRSRCRPSRPAYHCLPWAIPCVPGWNEKPNGQATTLCRDYFYVHACLINCIDYVVGARFQTFLHDLYMGIVNMAQAVQKRCNRRLAQKNSP